MPGWKGGRGSVSWSTYFSPEHFKSGGPAGLQSKPAYSVDERPAGLAEASFKSLPHISRSRVDKVNKFRVIMRDQASIHSHLLLNTLE